MLAVQSLMVHRAVGLNSAYLEALESELMKDATVPRLSRLRLYDIACWLAWDLADDYTADDCRFGEYAHHLLPLECSQGEELVSEPCASHAWKISVRGPQLEFAADGQSNPSPKSKKR